MASSENMAGVDTTISSVASCVKSDLLCLRDDLEKFLRVDNKENENKPRPILEPISEIIVTLQDCRKLITDIRHSALDRIAKRIID